MKKLVLFLIVSFALFAGMGMARAQKKTNAQPRSSAAEANWNSFRPETIQGTISMVVAKKKLVFVTASGGVSYDFLVTKKTKVEIGGRPSACKQLIGQAGKPATVTFVARPKGNFAQSISVSG